MTLPTNRYCDRLGLAVPRVEDALDRPEVKLFHLLVVALLERGAPMRIEEAADRLSAAGAEAASGDMVLSLKKAWHGREPVYRDRQGRLGLNLSSSELDHILFLTGLRGPRFEPPPPLPEPEVPGEDVPLSEEEIEAAFRDRSLYSLSSLRQAAAILDSRTDAMTPAQVNEVLAGFTRYRFSLGPETVRGWRSTLVSADAEGRFRLDRSSPDLGPMRRAVRKLTRPVLIQRAREERWRRLHQEYEARHAEEERVQSEAAARLRRAVLRVLPESGPPAAAALLDVAARSIHTFIGGQLADLRRALDRFDLLAGLRIRESLDVLGLDAERWRLVDLKPPQKTRRLNRRGRILSISPALLISSTTGISRPLGDPVKVSRYLAEGETAKLRRRLESDVKALYAFYSFGLLHRWVRLRWGFLDEGVRVDWALPGDPRLGDILRAARDSGAAVDLVLGSAPGWGDPWSRARHAIVQGLEPWRVIVRMGDEVWRLHRLEIQAIRLVS